MNSITTIQKAKRYCVGEHVKRPWGHYIVTALGVNESGEEYCEKHITLHPAQSTSLHFHKNRQELWTVIKGELNVTIGNDHFIVQKGHSIHIPVNMLHSMRNNTAQNCVVHERQTGICREEDITRHHDIYGRGGVPNAHVLSHAHIAGLETLKSQASNLAAD